MNLPFDTMTAAAFIKNLSIDILPSEIRNTQAIQGVPCLGAMGCRLLSMCAAVKQPKTIVDIGCGIGASTTSLATGAPEAGITAFDANADRVESCRRLTSGYKNVNVFQANAFDFLKDCTEKYDMAFVDSIKKDYPAIWQYLRPLMNPQGLVIFDDVLLHGYVADEDAIIPDKYKDGAYELRQFLIEISYDKTLHSQILPLDGGMLMVALK